MIELKINEKKKIVYTTWILKLNKDTKDRKIKSGEIKTYHSYFTSFPQELYQFFEIKDNSIYLIKDSSKSDEIIITDEKPIIPVTYIKVNLVVRRKNKNKIPTTTFTLSRKLFGNLHNSKEVIFTLYPASEDIYRNKIGIVSIKTN